MIPSPSYSSNRLFQIAGPCVETTHECSASEGQFRTHAGRERLHNELLWLHVRPRCRNAIPLACPFHQRAVLRWQHPAVEREIGHRDWRVGGHPERPTIRYESAEIRFMRTVGQAMYESWGKCDLCLTSSACSKMRPCSTASSANPATLIALVRSAAAPQTQDSSRPDGREAERDEARTESKESGGEVGTSKQCPPVLTSRPFGTAAARDTGASTRTFRRRPTG